MPFSMYDWVGIKIEKYKSVVNLDYDENKQEVYFIREILGNDQYICDRYEGENHIEKHYRIKIDTENYEKKDIKATFKVREFHPLTGTFVDDPKVYNTIQDAVSAGSLAPAFAIWGVSIICDSDCKAFGIDPAAPWPPRAA